MRNKRLIALALCISILFAANPFLSAAYAKEETKEVTLSMYSNLSNKTSIDGLYKDNNFYISLDMMCEISGASIEKIESSKVLLSTNKGLRNYELDFRKQILTESQAKIDMPMLVVNGVNYVSSLHFLDYIGADVSIDKDAENQLKIIVRYNIFDAIAEYFETNYGNYFWWDEVDYDGKSIESKISNSVVVALINKDSSILRIAVDTKGIYREYLEDSLLTIVKNEGQNSFDEDDAELKNIELLGDLVSTEADVVQFIVDILINDASDELSELSSDLSSGLAITTSTLVNMIDAVETRKQFENIADAQKEVLQNTIIDGYMDSPTLSDSWWKIVLEAAQNVNQRIQSAYQNNYAAAIDTMESTAWDFGEGALSEGIMKAGIPIIAAWNGIVFATKVIPYTADIYDRKIQFFNAYNCSMIQLIANELLCAAIEEANDAIYHCDADAQQKYLNKIRHCIVLQYKATISTREHLITSEYLDNNYAAAMQLLNKQTAILLNRIENCKIVKIGVDPDITDDITWLSGEKQATTINGNPFVIYRNALQKVASASQYTWEADIDMTVSAHDGQSSMSADVVMNQVSNITKNDPIDPEINGSVEISGGGLDMAFSYDYADGTAIYNYKRPREYTAEAQMDAASLMIHQGLAFDEQAIVDSNCTARMDGTKTVTLVVDGNIAGSVLSNLGGANQLAVSDLSFGDITIVATINDEQGLVSATIEASASMQMQGYDAQADYVYQMRFYNFEFDNSAGTENPEITQPENKIPADAVEYNGHYYYVYVDGTVPDYQSAIDYCNDRGGYLTVISSQDENDFIYNYIKEQGYSSAYFGYSDAASEGNWIWNNEEQSPYTNWHKDEPNGGAAENYAMFYSKFSDGTWNDGDFGEGSDGTGRAFICEWGSDVDAETEISSTANKTIEQIYSDYVKNTLITQYGQANPDAIQAVDEDVQGVVPDCFGVISTSLQDLDKDETPELLALIYENGTSPWDEFDSETCLLRIHIYRYENGIVRELSCSRGSNVIKELETSAPIGKNTVSLLDTPNGMYILSESVYGSADMNWKYKVWCVDQSGLQQELDLTFTSSLGNGNYEEVWARIIPSRSDSRQFEAHEYIENAVRLYFVQYSPDLVNPFEILTSEPIYEDNRHYLSGGTAIAACFSSFGCKEVKQMNNGADMIIEYNSDVDKTLLLESQWKNHGSIDSWKAQPNSSTSSTSDLASVVKVIQASALDKDYHKWGQYDITGDGQDELILIGYETDVYHCQDGNWIPIYSALKCMNAYAHAGKLYLDMNCGTGMRGVLKVWIEGGTTHESWILAMESYDAGEFFYHGNADYYEDLAWDETQGKRISKPEYEKLLGEYCDPDTVLNNAI